MCFALVIPLIPDLYYRIVRWYEILLREPTVTTGEPRTSDRPWAYFVFAFVVSVFVLLLCLGDFLNNTNDVAPEAALYLKCASLVLEGKQPYLDFYDSSPPLVYVLFSLPLHLSKAIGIPAVKALGLCVTALALFSCGFASFVMLNGLKVLQQEDMKSQPKHQDLKRQIEQAFVPLLLGFVTFNYWIGFEWGQIQHLFVLFYFPFLLVRWLRWNDLECHAFVCFLSGILASIGFCLDPSNFWIVIFGVEACLFLEHRKFKPFYTPEVGGMFAGFVGSNWHLMSLDQSVRDAYLDWIKPFATGFKSITSFDKATFGVESAPDRRDIVYLVSVTVALALPLSLRNSLLMPLSTVALAGFGLYVLEGEGFSFQFIIGQFGAVLLAATEVAFALRFIPSLFAKGSDTRRSIRVRSFMLLVLAGLLAFGCWARMQNLRVDMQRSIAEQKMKSPNMLDVETVIETESEPGDMVIVLSDAARPGFPSLFFLDRKPGYLLWGRAIRHLGWCSVKGLCQGAFEKYYDHVYHKKVPVEIQEHLPELVLIDKSGPVKELEPLGTIRLLQEHYDKIEDCHYFTNGKEPREVSGRNWDYMTFKRKRIDRPGSVEKEGVKGDADKAGNP